MASMTASAPLASPFKIDAGLGPQIEDQGALAPVQVEVHE